MAYQYQKHLQRLNSYINGDSVHVRYTLKTDDITKGAKPFAMPYRDRKGYFDETGYCEAAKATLRLTAHKDGIKILLKSELEDISEFGISLPINFMGKLNGGGWENQYLLNSPYTSQFNTYKYCYLSNPNGKNLIIFPKGKCDGWKCDYSSEYCPGHFFIELEFLANFDKAYHTGSSNRSLELYIFEVSDFAVAVDKMCEVLNTCALTYDKSAEKIGEKIKLFVHGACDRVRCGRENYIPQNGTVEILVKKHGLIRAIPYMRNKRGMDAQFFGYKSVKRLFKMSMDSVSQKEIATTDQNLCEHQCWQSAMLRYMLRFEKNGKYIKEVKKGLAVIMEKDEAKALPRRTIYYKRHKNAPPYTVFESARIQELLFGVTILTDAYKFTGKKKYFYYLTRALNSVLKYNFDNGMIHTVFLNGKKEDYTTVCCLIIPFVDAAILLRETHPQLAEKYRIAAEKIAAYLYNRQGFHTEAFVSDKTEPEMEDGSISCTALSLLYYCAKIERKEEYIIRAKEILDMHDAWVTHTPIAPCFHSSLRWWETFWNGDATGPSICFGHAWTIWRAEADYWYYYLTKNEKYKTKAINGFMSNLSKIQTNGKMYSCYLLDYIPGGGFHTDSKDTVFEIRQGVPNRKDSCLSRYVWVRAHESILNEDWI